MNEWRSALWRPQYVRMDTIQTYPRCSHRSHRKKNAAYDKSINICFFKYGIIYNVFLLTWIVAMRCWIEPSNWIGFLNRAESLDRTESSNWAEPNRFEHTRTCKQMHTYFYRLYTFKYKKASNIDIDTCTFIYISCLSIFDNPEPGFERFVIKKCFFQVGPLFHM